MRLEEGFAWLKPAVWTDFPYRGNPQAQATKLLQLSIKLETRNRYGTVLYFFPMTVPKYKFCGLARQ